MPQTAMHKLRIGMLGDRSRGRTRRPPISFSRIARSEGYTNAANVWAVSLVQGPFSVAPCQTLPRPIRLFTSLYGGAVCVSAPGCPSPGT
jgi:hypothetical protein